MGMQDDSNIDDMFRRFMSIGVSQSEVWMQDGSSVTSAGSQEPSGPLCGLDTITIPELSFSSDHSGRVLYGQFAIEPSLRCSQNWSVDDVATLLMDTTANAIRVIMSKDIWDTAPMPERNYRFSLGKRVAIKEPLLEMCSDGVYAVRLIDPCQVICLEKVKEEGQAPAEMSGAASLEELEKIRHEGNQLFAEKKWAAAVNKYSECINLCNQTLCKLDSTPSPHTTSEKKFSHFLMLTYSNRAEARLRLLHYEDAFSDVEKALDIEPKHVKTLVRKGKAAHGLGLYEKACEAFKSALAKSPEQRPILKDLIFASVTAVIQSRPGQYDLSNFYLSGCMGEAPPCADFVGPVEIRRVGYGHGRRGLFATRNVKPGELLLLSNPMAVVRQNQPVPAPDDFFTKRNLNDTQRRNLISEVLKRIITSKRHMAQLNSLCGVGRKEEMEIPSMELFRAGSEWLPDGSEKFKADAEHVGAIVSLNATGKFEQFNLVDSYLPTCEILLGIWALPSFTNHSCSPNICRTYIGDAVCFRASENIGKGKELTISYLVDDALVTHGVEARQADTNDWFFTCACGRCLLEQWLQPMLSKINKAHSDLLEAASGETKTNQFQNEEWLSEKLQESRNFANLADEVERVIQSHCSTLGPKEHGWIRAKFCQAYNEKFALTILDDSSDLQLRVSALRLALHSMTAVSGGPLALNYATLLLQTVDIKCGKHSQMYKLTFDRVLGVFKVYFGEQPKDIMRKIIKEYSTLTNQ
ncbi:unnamed protein product [Calypogeia fissa]